MMRWIPLAVTCILLASPGYAEDDFHSAQEFYQRGEQRAAVIELKNLLRDQPDHGAGRRLLGELYLAQGDFAGAEKELSRAQTLGANDPRLPLLLATALLAQGQPQRAGEQLGTTDPGDPALAADYWVLRGDIQRSQSRFAAAEQAYQQALDRQDSVPARAGLIALALSRQQPDQALALINALEPGKQTATIKRLAGQSYLLKRQPQQALNAFDDALQLDPGDPRAALGKVRALLLKGAPGAAREATDTLLQRAPEWPEALMLSAALSLHEGRPEQSKRITDSLLARYPKSGPLLNLAAYVNLALGNGEQAKRHLNQYLAQTDDTRARMTLANLHRRQNDLDQAATLLAPLLGPDEPVGDAYALLGAIRLQQGKAEAAAEAFRRSLELGSDPKIGRPLALSELLSGNREAGTQRLEALAKQQADPRTDALLLRAYMAEQQPVKARRLIETRLEEGAPPLLYRLMAASLELSLQERGAALEHLDRALEDAPNALAALLGKAHVLVLTGALQEAEALYQQAIKAAPDDLRPLRDYAQLLLLQKRSEPAVERVARYLAQHAGDLEATMLYLYVLERAGQIERLGNALQEAMARFPDAPRIALTAAELATSKGDRREADRLINSLVQQHADFIPGQLAKIKSQLAAGESEAALYRIEGLPQRVKQHPDTLLLQGDALFASGRMAEAERAYLSAYQATPSPQAVDRLTRLWLANNHSGGALARLQQLLAIHPDDTASLMALAGLNLQQQDFEAAMRGYRRVTELQPRHAIAWNNLAWLYQQQSDARAVKAAENALALQPNAAPVMDTAGWIFLDAGRDQQALALLAEAAVRLPDVASVQYHYAVALVSNGQLDEALKVLAPLRIKEFPEKEQAMALSQKVASERRTSE